MDRRLLNIAQLKQQQKRCTKCHKKMTIAFDAKLKPGAKLGKWQDPYYFIYSGAPLSKKENFLPTIKKLNRIRFVTRKRRFKDSILKPQMRHIYLECTNCKHKYYTFVYERSSELL